MDPGADFDTKLPALMLMLLTLQRKGATEEFSTTLHHPHQPQPTVKLVVVEIREKSGETFEIHMKLKSWNLNPSSQPVSPWNRNYGILFSWVIYKMDSKDTLWASTTWGVKLTNIWNDVEPETEWVLKCWTWCYLPNETSDSITSCKVYLSKWPNTGWGVILTDVWNVKWERTLPTMLSIAKATRSNKCSSSDWGGLKLRAIWNRTWATRRNRKSSVQMQQRSSRKHCNSFKHQSQAASGTSKCFVDYRKRNVVLKHQHFICCCF